MLYTILSIVFATVMCVQGKKSDSSSSSSSKNRGKSSCNAEKEYAALLLFMADFIDIMTEMSAFDLSEEDGQSLLDSFLDMYVYVYLRVFVRYVYT